MSLVAVERIKLFSTRSPWWCMVIAAILAIGFVTLGYIFAPDDVSRAFRPVDTQGTYQFGLMVMMIMAALSASTEYRFNTIKTSFLAVPQRSSVLLAKAAVAAVLSGVIGLAAGFGAWALGLVLVPDADLALNSSNDWRALLGVGLVYVLGAVIAVGVGVLVRHSAAAISIVVLWPLLVEGIAQAIPKVGDFVVKWGPFSRANWFITGDQGPAPGDEGAPRVEGMSPTWSIIYFAGWAAAVLIVALIVASRRDA